MSDCWNCQKKDACERLYLNGEQQNCLDKAYAYTSLKDYIKWLAISKDFYFRDIL